MDLFVFFKTVKIVVSIKTGNLFRIAAINWFFKLLIKKQGGTLKINGLSQEGGQEIPAAATRNGLITPHIPSWRCRWRSWLCCCIADRRILPSACSLDLGVPSAALRASFYVRTCGANNVVYVVAACKVDRGVTNCGKKKIPQKIYIYIFMRCGRDVYTLRAIGYYCISVQAG